MDDFEKMTIHGVFFLKILSVWFSNEEILQFDYLPLRRERTRYLEINSERK